MRRVLLHQWFLTGLASLAFVAAALAQTSSTEVAGNYAGTLDASHVLLKVHQDPSGLLTATLDSAPCDQLTVSGRHFSFVVPSFQGIYDGELSPDGKTITGTMRAVVGTPGTLSFPLVFRRKPEATAARLSTQIATIDSMAAAEFAKRPIGSVTVGAIAAKGLIWTKSFGNADTERERRANQETVYRIGSITKMFTALMLEQLVDAGTVHLSDPVEKYFPEVNLVPRTYAGASPITLIQLATHTSGLGREPDDMARYVRGPVADWEKTLTAALPHVHYVCEPGTRFFYSNIGYAILGAALARAAGQPYVNYLPAHIFAPLGMRETALEPTPSLRQHLSSGYQITKNGIDTETPLAEQAGRGYKVPNGAIYTTVGDLAKFASFLMDDGPQQVLKTASLERYVNQVQVSADAQLAHGSGLGFTLIRRDGYTAFGHGGAVAGYQAALFVNRDDHIGVIVLANALGPGSIDTEGLALRSLDLLSKTLDTMTN